MTKMRQNANIKKTVLWRVCFASSWYSHGFLTALLPPVPRRFSSTPSQNLPMWRHTLAFLNLFYYSSQCQVLSCSVRFFWGAEKPGLLPALCFRLFSACSEFRRSSLPATLFIVLRCPLFFVRSQFLYSYSTVQHFSTFSFL